MGMTLVDNHGGGLLAPAHGLQKCNFLTLTLSSFDFTLMLMDVHIFFVRNLSGLGLSGSLGYQLGSMTSVTNL